MRRFCLLFILLILIGVIVYSNKIQEGFVGEPDTYSDLDAKLFEKVFSNDAVYEFDITTIADKLSKQLKEVDIKILDAGTGTGRHYEQLHKKLGDKATIIGADRSANMLKCAQLRNPGGEFVNGDLRNQDMFKAGEFNYIIATMDTLYHCRENVEILRNFHRWLKSGGTLFVHLFDPKKLDPGPQPHSQYYQSKTDSKRHALTYFDGFAHDAYWDAGEDGSVSYVQSFITDEGIKRTKRIQLYIPNKPEMIKRIEGVGFKLSDIISLTPLSITDFELFCFTKQ